MVHQVDSAKNVRLATSCTECQRRKQKCSREWPCNHCQARRIGHLCKFTPKKSLKTSIRHATSGSSLLQGPQETNVDLQREFSSQASPAAVANVEDLRALGYLHDDPAIEDEDAISEISVALSHKPCTSSLEMENALRTIPPKPYTDILISQFINDTNYQYYSIYPPTFLHDYSTWWSGKAKGQNLTPEFTSLLLHICACSALFVDLEVKQKLETELGENIQGLCERYHHTAKQLGNTIPPGKGGLTRVQQLFISAVWYKAEALFVESWHALSSAIHEAQELGMHKVPSKVKMSEFDHEMRKRMWCILYAWDWQMSLLLARPFIINSNYCAFNPPNLRFGSVGPEAQIPSPISHIVLECQLGQTMTKIPGVVGGVLSPTQAVSIQQEIEKWFAALPPPLRLKDPDTRWDESHIYVKMQRLQLHTIGYMVMLLPLKQCLTTRMGQDTSTIVKSLQPTAVDCALNLINAARHLLEFTLPINAKFHFAPFMLFDTAATLCSAIAHNQQQNLPRRNEVVEAIRLTLSLLGQICNSSKVGALCYGILTRIVAGISVLSHGKTSVDSQSTANSSKGLQTPSGIPGDLATLPGELADCSTVAYGNMIGTGLTPPETTSGMAAFADLPNLDLEELGPIWDLDNLDLDIPWSSAL